MICAIHQPNFFPWLGYFDKIARSDVFIFLDHVDYEKSGHSMQSITNRVSIIGGERIHCPVIREHGPQLIDSVIINFELPWKQEVMAKLERKYSKAPFWDEASGLISELINYPTSSLSELNINAITRICHEIGFDTRLFKQSDYDVDGHSNQLLINLVKESKCSEYIHGKGGNKYQDVGMFENAGIKLVPQDFEPWHYYQGGASEFTKGLSIIDALCWIGINETGSMVRKNAGRL